MREGKSSDFLRLRKGGQSGEIDGRDCCAMLSSSPSRRRRRGSGRPHLELPEVHREAKPASAACASGVPDGSSIRRRDRPGHFAASAPSSARPASTSAAAASCSARRGPRGSATAKAATLPPRMRAWGSAPASMSFDQGRELAPPGAAAFHGAARGPRRSRRRRCPLSSPGPASTATREGEQLARLLEAVAAVDLARRVGVDHLEPDLGEAGLAKAGQVLAHQHDGEPFAPVLDRDPEPADPGALAANPGQRQPERLAVDEADDRLRQLDVRSRDVPGELRHVEGERHDVGLVGAVPERDQLAEGEVVRGGEGDGGIQLALPE